ncbi:MATE family efflux transporter [Rhodoferax sediminis]|uniref:MATE family efflux transporter n=1 Tax=Rhodoferax sediminis TaxID=2509614 RepID=A0A515DAM4_9BURK|nr:MATE family efflux transporter [Rhodoferax sediminis]QDL37473.1 MATE family efflux transporter [Rhodoferax sediminis]
MPELKVIIRHAVTVLVGQLAVMAFGVTDTIVAGRYSETSLAALSVGSAIYISVYVALMGVMQALLPVWAEQHGARRLADVGRSLRQALYLCAITIVVGMAALLSPDAVLRWTEVPAALQVEVQRYLGVLALALAPSLLFRIYSTLNQSLGKPQLVTWLQIGSLFVKVPLSIWFAFGGLGLAPQGVVGCAWATLVVNYAMLALALWLLRTQDFYLPYRIWQRLERPDWRQIGEFARLGIPGGLAILVEITSFTLMALFIARQGTAAAASHQIAANLAAVLYMMPLSIAIATSARTSYWLGAGDPRRARAAIRMGFRLVALMAIALSTILFIARGEVAEIYARNPAVIALASALLAWVAAYHLADAVQTLCVFVLRCYRVTVAPLLVYCVLLWGLGLTGGYLLAYHGVGAVHAIASPITFWATSAIALALTATIFAAILWRAVRRPAARQAQAQAPRRPAP